MNTYLVRLKDDHELVGLFVSANDKSLWRVIDEVCDTDLCEFLELPAGAIYLPEAGAPSVPTTTRKATPVDFFAAAVISEGWHEAFHEEAEWQSIGP